MKTTIFILTLVILFPVFILNFFSAYEVYKFFWDTKTLYPADTEQKTAGPSYKILTELNSDNWFHFYQSVLLFLTVGDEKGGQMVLHGRPDIVAQLGPQ